MSKMSQLAHEMDECSTFSAWSADGKTEVQLEAPIDPDRLDQGNYINNSDTVVDERVDVDDYPMNGQITFLEPHEIHTIHFLSENIDDEYDRNVLKQIYERVK
tara:strand:- start:1426 stop:1734 length:309 start_codon:yes stop_codon:yes gene_type:complete